MPTSRYAIHRLGGTRDDYPHIAWLVQANVHTEFARILAEVDALRAELAAIRGGAA